jgi:hypothetical protein
MTYTAQTKYSYGDILEYPNGRAVDRCQWENKETAAQQKREGE